MGRGKRDDMDALSKVFGQGDGVSIQTKEALRKLEDDLSPRKTVDTGPKYKEGKMKQKATPPADVLKAHYDKYK